MTHWKISKVLLLMAVATELLLCPSLSRSQDGSRNGWGIYVAPTTSQFISGPDYDRTETNTALDFGIYLRRLVSPTIALRLEVRTAQRASSVTVQSGSETAAFHVSEEFLSVPLFVELQRAFALGHNNGHVIFGAGVSYSVLLEQEVFPPDLTANSIQALDFGDYGSTSFLFNGGISFEAGRQRVVARFQGQWDADLSGVPSDAFARRYFAYGFQAGLEWPF